MCSMPPLSLEIEDVDSFRAFMKTGEASKYPFATIVALHNIVTSTVPVSHWRGYPKVVGDRRYFCVREAAALISKEMKHDDIPGATYPGIPSLPRGVTLPGISRTHRLISCPS